MNMKKVVFVYTKWSALGKLDKDESLQKKEAGKLDSKTTVKDWK